MHTSPSLLSNDELLTELKALAHDERAATVTLIALLAECDTRKPYLEKGYPSLFQYCVFVLHLSGHAAYHRIVAARCARQFPIVLEQLAAGSVNLTTIKLLAPHLTPENHLWVLAEARHKSRRKVEELVARLRPLPAVPSVVRKLPEAKAPGLLGLGGEGPGGERGLETASSSDLPAEPALPQRNNGDLGAYSGGASDPDLVSKCGAQATSGAERLTMGQGAPVATLVPPQVDRRPAVSPLAPELYKIQFTATGATYRKLRQAQELLRHQVPNGDPGVIMDLALSALLERLIKQKLGSGKRRRSTARGNGKRNVNPSNSVRTESKQAPARGTEAGSTLAGAVRSEVEASETARPAEVPCGEGPHPGKPPTRSRKSSAQSRHIPKRIRREVWKRDRGQCAFVSRSGMRCRERGGLEFHHVEPYAWGGKATVQNIELRCRPHNAYEGELYFGPRRRSPSTEPLASGGTAGP